MIFFKVGKMILLYLFLFFIVFNLYTYLSLYVHEFGHFFAAKLLGAMQTKIVLNIKNVNPSTTFSFGRKMSNLENCIITLSGVILQLTLSILMLLQNYSLFIKIVAVIHIPAILINILPLKPLDGYYLLPLLKNIKGSIVFLYFLFISSMLISIYFTWKYLIVLFDNSLSNALIIMILPAILLYKMFRKISKYRSIEYGNKG